MGDPRRKDSHQISTAAPMATRSGTASTTGAKPVSARSPVMSVALTSTTSTSVTGHQLWSTCCCRCRFTWGRMPVGPCLLQRIATSGWFYLVRSGTRPVVLRSTAVARRSTLCSGVISVRPELHAILRPMAIALILTAVILCIW